MQSKELTKSPRIVIADRLRQAYLDGIELVFGADTKHVQAKGFCVKPNTNFERFHGTLKARLKVMRRLREKEIARLIIRIECRVKKPLRQPQTRRTATPKRLDKIIILC